MDRLGFQHNLLENGHAFVAGLHRGNANLSLCAWILTHLLQRWLFLLI